MQPSIFNYQSESINLKSPPWLPTPLKTRLQEKGRLEITTKFSKADRKVMRKRRKVPVSQWAEKHRVVTMSSLPGPWKNHVTSYLAGIMDASFYSSVQTVIVCKAPQTGGSEATHNCIGYSIDRAPGPVLYIYPDEQTARDNNKDRIQPMIEGSPRLRSYMTGVDDDATSLRVNLQHMPIYMGWARSAARLANKPIKYLVFDETDKYPDTAGKREADPISLGEKRTTTYKWNRKIWKLSTPTIEAGHIWQALTKEAQVVFDYFVKCPFCDDKHLMTFEQIKWSRGISDEHPDPERMESEKLAWYECPDCGEKWKDEHRNKAVKNGEWRVRKTGDGLSKYLKKHRPLKIGFHVPSWISYFVSLSEVAAAFLRGLKNKTKLKDFQNAHKAEPWFDYTLERSEDKILALRDDRPRGLVPGNNSDIVAGLTAAVDTHKSGFYFEIKAWGYGLIQESWQIREGFVTSFDALGQVLFDDIYMDHRKNQYIVKMAVMDAMGGRTSEVYDWCRLHRRRVCPFKGEHRMNQPFAYSKIDTYPKTNKPIPGGIQLLRANVNYFKDLLSSKLEIAPADPGAWHLHSEATQEYARQMTAEYVDEKGLWQCMSGRANEAWDLSVYNLVAAEVKGFKYWSVPDATGKADKKSGRKVRSTGYEKLTT